MLKSGEFKKCHLLLLLFYWQAKYTNSHYSWFFVLQPSSFEGIFYRAAELLQTFCFQSCQPSAVAEPKGRPVLYLLQLQMFR